MNPITRRPKINQPNLALSYQSLAVCEDTGLQPELLSGLLERAQREVGPGLLPSCQLALAHNGRLVLFETLGEAAANSRYVIFSVTKPLIASAIWLLMAEGLLDIDKTVVSYIPEFCGEGKEAVTVAQLLTHTSGFPHAPMGPRDWSTRESRLQRMAQWRLNWEPGSRCEYHQSSAHWVLAELIERLGGMDFRDYVRQRILEPLGLHGPLLGVPESQQGDINPLVTVGQAPTAAELEQILGIAIELPELSDDVLLRFNEPGLRALGMPGAGGIGTAADVALFYQALMHNPGHTWDPAILADATGNIRVTYADALTGAPANRSLGLVVQCGDVAGSLLGMGKTTSPGSFGHQGVGGQIAWADPATGISFCFLTNGLDANPIRAARRGSALSNRAAKCAL